ncbi:ribosome biogenesis factor YjgA [Robbsia sp. KACC 23696]|uniref:ribosome biogenesis factor YjgA n=1 Tax=Robbsia sp. KACC 23696 TaxID=3149231 RepID=UPI00325AF2D4
MTRKRNASRAGEAGRPNELPESPLGPDGQPVYDRPSKTQLKRDMTALQKLGKELAELPKEAFRKLPLPEALFDALTETRRISDHEGRRRQLQFVGKVMRRLDDEDVAALRQTLDKIRGISRAETVKLHAIERWRDVLIESDEALTDFMQRYPEADVQQGRTLIRNARREGQQQGSPRYYRELFQWVKAAHEAHEGGGSDEETDDADSDEDDDDDFDDRD